MREFPAIDLRWSQTPSDDDIALALADVDEYGPSSVEETTGGARIFFSTALARDRALLQLAVAQPDIACSAIEVPDEHWAERSQAALTAVRVGRLIVAPPWAAAAARSTCADDDIVVTIQPSMGFGTGHHQSTRLCLHLLQRCGAEGASMLDVGTGSGVLAIAACALGARTVLAADYDPDALISARENIDLNGAGEIVSAIQLDIARDAPPAAGPFDVVTANLTGAMLERFAPALAAWTAPEGALIASGFEDDEAAGVERAFAAAGRQATDRISEDRWIALLFRSSGS